MEARLTELPPLIEAQVQLVAIARHRQAIEARLMSNYVEYDGIRFHRPTLIHLWLSFEMERLRCWESGNERIRLQAYSLMFDAAAARHELMRQLQRDAAAVKTAAQVFFDRNPEALAVAAVLLDDLSGDDGDDDDGGLLELDWWSRAVHRVAAAYHWSEREIFALPLVRLVAYSRTIRAANGEGETVRQVALLPEERELRRLLKLRLAAEREERKHGGKQ